MKQVFLAVGLSVLTGLAAMSQAKPKTTTKPKPVTGKQAVGALRSSADSFSYALGMNIANNLKQQGIEKISNAAMQKGLDDVFNKRSFLLNEQQANMCIQQTIMQNMSKRNEAVKAKGAAFLAENKKREGVITLPDGLQYEVLKKGDASSPTPKLQDTFVVHYRGTRIDGVKFDASYDRGEPLTMPVSGVVPGWTEVLQLMHIGDKFKVYIPSELGYGDRGAGADIPGGSTLIFEMELLGIKPGVPAETPKQN
jgi:FKBP-type peptidyl-prolyl cis-trans isomerase FklB